MSNNRAPFKISPDGTITELPRYGFAADGYVQQAKIVESTLARPPYVYQLGRKAAELAIKVASAAPRRHNTSALANARMEQDTALQATAETPMQDPNAQDISAMETVRMPAIPPQTGAAQRAPTPDIIHQPGRQFIAIPR